MKLNLQYFAEEATSETNVEVAEPQETVNEEPSSDSVEETESEEVQEVAKPVQSKEENSRYAAARREAEAKQKALDDKFAKMFGDYENPITGEKITGVESYLTALQAQQELEQSEKLRSAGIDPSIINEMIANNPTVIQAQEVMRNAQAAETERMIADDLKVIQEIDPEIRSLEDILNGENSEQIMGYVTNNNLRLADAYKLANLGKIAEKNRAAAKQAAINQAKGKSHLESTTSLGTDDNSMTPIPAKVLARWKEAYPELTVAQLTAKYNNAI